MAKKISIIIGSVRSNRAGKAVADWVMESASERDSGVTYELIDLKEVNLPYYDEPTPPMMGAEPVHETTRAWRGVINGSDGFIFVTPEYNHGYSPALKNAIDHAYSEWGEKPAAMVGYGSGGAVHSIRQLREILEFLKLKVLEDQVGVSSIWEAFDNDGHVKPEYVSGSMDHILDRLEEALLGAPVGV